MVVKRSNSQLRHKGESKPRASGGRQAGAEYFETIDSGWTSRDSSSMDRWAQLHNNQLIFKMIFIREYFLNAEFMMQEQQRESGGEDGRVGAGRVQQDEEGRHAPVRAQPLHPGPARGPAARGLRDVARSGERFLSQHFEHFIRVTCFTTQSEGKVNLTRRCLLILIRISFLI